MPARRRWPLLVIAAVLLAAGAWLMGEGAPEKPDKLAKVTLPRAPTQAELAQRRHRLQIISPVAPPDAGRFALPPKPRTARDPLLALMPETVEHVALVMEVNAIRYSDLGDQMVECFSGKAPDLLGEMKDAGLDPFNAIDRVSVADGVVMLSGNFAGLDWQKLEPNALESDYGPRTKLYTRTLRDGGEDATALWSSQLMVSGSPAEVKAAIDRLEHAPEKSGYGALSPDQAYGEMYGVIKPAAMAALFESEDPKMAQLLRETAQNIELHMDVSHDVGLVADIEGERGAKTDDLRKSLGGALSLLRLKAKADGKADEAELLEMARVRPARDGQFRLEAGVPHAMMKKQLEDCIARNKAKPADAGN